MFWRKCRGIEQAEQDQPLLSTAEGEGLDEQCSDLRIVCWLYSAPIRAVPDNQRAPRPFVRAAEDLGTDIWPLAVDAESLPAHFLRILKYRY